MIRNLLLLIGSTLLALAIGITVWPWILGDPSADALPGYSDLVNYDPSRPGGHLRPNMDTLVRGERRGESVRWVTNAQGFRNSQPVARDPQPGVFRILFYGDSFVDGMRTDQANTIGALLERQLNESLPGGDGPWKSAEVLISGHNNPANAWYHWQRHGRGFNPHMVILGLTLGNDITWHNLGGGVRPLVRGNRIDLAPAEGAGMSDVGYYDLQMPDAAFRERGLAARVWRDIRFGFRRFFSSRFYFASNWLPPLMGPTAPSPGQLPASGPFVALGLFLMQPQAEIERLWGDFSFTLEGMGRDVRSNGIPFLLIPFPVRIQVDPLDWRSLVDAYDLDHSKFAIDLPNWRVATLCKQTGTWCADPLEQMRSGAEQEALYRPLGDMHLNNRGQATVARFLFEQLNGLDLPLPSPVPGPQSTDSSTIVRNWQYPRLVERYPWLVRGRPATLSANGERQALRNVMTSGWSFQGTGAIWSSGEVAYMDIPVIQSGAATQVEVNIKPFLVPERVTKQLVSVTRETETLAEWSLANQDFEWRCVVIPDSGFLLTRIKWELPLATAPASANAGSDLRELGVAVATLRLSAATPDNSCVSRLRPNGITKAGGN